MKNPGHRSLLFCLLINHATSAARNRQYIIKAPRNVDLQNAKESGSRVRGLKERNIFGEKNDSIDGRKTSSLPPASGDIRTVDIRGRMKKGKGKSKKEYSYFYEFSEENSEINSEINSGDEPKLPETSEDFPSTQEPTLGSTNRPSPQPTVSTATPELPTFPPSLVPTTSKPTLRPTSFVTPKPVQPVPSPTQSPSKVLTRKPTFGPTSFPSRATLDPTLATTRPTPPLPTTSAPSPIQTTASIGACRIDKDGLFGTTQGDATEVEFLFQMEIFPGVTIKEAINQIEKAVANLLLSDLFPNDCLSPNQKKMSSNPVETRQPGIYNGVSTAPQGAVASGFECVGVFLDPCFVVQGALTVYSEFVEGVEYEVSTRIYAILEFVDEDLIDIDRVTPLRDVDMLREPLDSLDFPVESKEGVEDSRSRTSQELPGQTIDSLASPTAVQSEAPKTTIRSLILSFVESLPWWLWLCVSVWLIAIVGLKLAVTALFQDRKGGTKEPTSMQFK